MNTQFYFCYGMLGFLFGWLLNAIYNDFAIFNCLRSVEIKESYFGFFFYLITLVNDIFNILTWWIPVVSILISAFYHFVVFTHYKVFSNKSSYLSTWNYLFLKITRKITFKWIWYLNVIDFSLLEIQFSYKINNAFSVLIANINSSLFISLF